MFSSGRELMQMLGSLKPQPPPFEVSDLNIVRYDRTSFEASLAKCLTVRTE